MSISSFDVFDTAITRLWLRPTDLFLPVGATLRQHGLFAGSDEAWRALRIEAEASRRDHSGKEEVTLDEIFDDLSTRLGWTDGQRARAATIELDQEMACVRPIGRTLARIAAERAAQRDVIFVSDTYFSRAFVLGLLRRCGYVVGEEALHASSEIQLTKRTGSLFDHVATRHGVAPGLIAHTGDNLHADVKSARRHGVAAEHFRDQEPNRYETLFFADEEIPLGLRSAFAGCSRTARLRNEASGDAKIVWDTAANVVGPLLFAYVLWTLLEARTQGVRRLYFLARDGQILLGIATRIVAWLGLNIECRYLYVSREALFLASVDTADACSAAWLTDILSGATLRAVLRRVDLVPEEVAATLAARGIDHDADGTLSPADLSRLVTLFAEDEGLRTLLLDRAARRRALLLDYLRQEGFADGTVFGLVDVGWKGRLQFALGRAMRAAPDLADALPLRGFYFGLSVRPPPQTGDVSTFAEVDGDINAVLLETFCAADHGTTRAYRRLATGRVEPVLAEKSNAAALAWGLGQQQAAAQAFVDDLTDCLDATGIDVARLQAFARDCGLAAFRLLVHRPSPAEARVFGAFGHAEGQAHADEAQLAPPLRRSELLRWLLRPRRATRVQTFWPEGSFARSVTGTPLRACQELWRLRGDLVALKRRIAG